MSSDSEEEQIFVKDNGEPIKFFLHKGIKDLFQRSNLKTDIEENGGTLVDVDEGDVTVLVPPGFDRDGLQRTYYGYRDRKKREVYVEYINFVQRCIERGRFEHREKIRKGMGGRSDGRSRMRFTEEDDENLCHWIAMQMPEKAAGGRYGGVIYSTLMKSALHDPLGYAWAKRHTEDSWRERYRKNAASFDARISQIVAVEKPNERQHWHEDRRLSKGILRRRSAHIELEEEEEEEEEEEDLETGRPEQEELGRREDERETGRPEELIQGSATRSSRRKRKSGTRPASEASSKRQRLAQEPTRPAHVDHPRSKRLSKGKERQRTRSPPGLEPEAEDEAPFYHPNSLFSAVDDTFNEPSSPETQNHAAPYPSGTPPISAEFFPTQTTLVGTAPTPPAHSSKGRQTTAPVSMRSPSVEPEAPYRNTRSRSRSVQPYVMPVPTKKKRAKRKTEDAEGHDKLPLEPVNEAFDNEQFNPIKTDHVDVPVPETLVEEMDVEEQLLANRSTLSPLSSHDINTLAPNTRNRTNSLATDDAQTHIALRPRPFPVVQSSRASSAFDIDPAYMLRQFERATSRASLPTPYLPIAQPSQPRQSEPSRRNLPSSTPLPSTPIPVPPRQRKESTSSAESFPVAGTRASAMKKKLEQQEKNTPYKPPAGSRAAKRLEEWAKRGRA